MDLIFIGASVTFSRRTLKLVNQEFPGVRASRLGSIEDFVGEKTPCRKSPRLIVVDELFVEDLVTRPRVYREAAGSADLVLAYTRPAAARRIMAPQGDATVPGVVKLLPMNMKIEAWLSVLCLLIHGETYIPPDLLVAEAPTSAPAVSVASATTPRAEGLLTAREMDVLELVAAGKSNKVIAGQLRLSEHTVKLHMHHILAKLGLDNRTGAARWYIARYQGAAEAARLSP